MSEPREIVKGMQSSPMVPIAPVNQSSPETLRGLMAVVFRNLRLMKITFVSAFAGAVLVVLLFGIKYEVDTQILVKNRRFDPVMSTDTNPPDGQNSADSPVEREINTEISLLKSQDLMADVAKASGLDAREKHFWNFLIPGRDEDWRVDKAARKLAADLRVTEIPQSNMIQVSYRSSNPDLAARVMRELDRLYLEKHLAVYRPPGEFEFFHGQTEHYQEELEQAEQQLASYDLQKDASDPELDKEILLKKAGDFDGSLQETEAAITQTSRRIGELSSLLHRTPDRLTTQETVGDNPQLLAFLKSNLTDLESKRTDLLTKYQPTYRLVQEVDKQIADLKTAIAAESQKPVKQMSTGENPTYQLLQEEMVKANEDLTSYRARARATAPIVEAYRQQALLVDQKGIQRQDLMRNIKAAETNYLLYVQKQEQARIADEMDKDRILNVAVAEAPTVPSMPVFSPLMMILAGGVLALMLSVAAGFLADYLDPSFRTPDELVEYLGVPLLATFAKNGHPPRFGRLPGGRGSVSAPLAGSELREALPQRGGATE
jgi:uncharacterized protein involved in exopolysaccharide biosynthesis